ncbi:MFS toxin efflux pump [Lasiodiplodia theobromae]|uniref:MFS toxin efflux pump n=1 Tax=Lasiodiplodia theobromae TaxID=45133 RepID=UPI0015C3D3BD|nr:MFS toxin efflux pump [Lasiodiplodia theobromae]KAF4540686.1 MFS toxin efflux pump [Lasiodiplodia theobromae]
MASTQQLPAPASEKGHDADSTQKEAHTAQQPASTESDSGTESEDATQYVQGFRLVCLIVGLILAVFCLGLDRTILATAVPKITNEFNSLEDVAWYGSSFALTTCCFQLIFGKLFAEFKTLWVYLAALGIFEVGSIVCAAAPNSVALIIGRAVTGVGCAGVLAGTFIIIAQSFPLQKRPVYTGIIGGIAGIAEIIAPALGGAFTDSIGWRWCFWINLPLGAVTAVVVFFVVQSPDKPKAAESTKLVQILGKMDPLGTALLMPYMICLLLALQWGGTTYAWSNWRIILCFCLFAVMFLAWVWVQHSRGDAATLPLRLIRQRSVGCATFFMLGLNGVIFLVVYYVSIWFQAVKDVSAQQSGIDFLASSASISVASLLSGILVTKIGYYVPQMLLSTALVSASVGMMYAYDLGTSTVYWAASLVMFGFGSGMGMQMPLTAVQTVLKGTDIALGTSVLLLAQSLSGAIFLSVGQNLFATKLLEELKSRAPGVDATVVVNNGASGLKALVTEKYGAEAATAVLQAYNIALRQCFLVCVILSCLTILSGLGTEWKSVKGDQQQKDGADAESGADEKTG